MTPSRIRALAFALMVLGVPSLGAAQAPAFDDAIRAAAALRHTARQAGERFARPEPFVDGLEAARGYRSRKREGATLMLIGGGAVVVGAIAGGGGGTVLIVGGVVCAGYGFYLYSE